MTPFRPTRSFQVRSLQIRSIREARPEAHPLTGWWHGRPLLGCFLFVIACGGTAGGDAAADPETQAIDACSLLTKAEVEQLLGATVDEPQGTEGETSVPGGQGLRSQCNYDRGVTDGVAIVVRQFLGESDRLTRVATSAEVAEELEAGFADDRADPELAPSLPSVEPVDLAGHAAAAVVWDSFVNLTVHVRGQTRLQLAVTAPTLEVAREIVLLALSRLTG